MEDELNNILIESDRKKHYVESQINQIDEDLSLNNYKIQGINQRIANKCEYLEQVSDMQTDIKEEISNKLVILQQLESRCHLKENEISICNKSPLEKQENQQQELWEKLVMLKINFKHLSNYLYHLSLKKQENMNNQLNLQNTLKLQQKLRIETNQYNLLLQKELDKKVHFIHEMQQINQLIQKKQGFNTKTQSCVSMKRLLQSQFSRDEFSYNQLWQLQQSYDEYDIPLNNKILESDYNQQNEKLKDDFSIKLSRDENQFSVYEKPNIQNDNQKIYQSAKSLDNDEIKQETKTENLCQMNQFCSYLFY